MNKAPAPFVLSVILAMVAGWADEKITGSLNMGVVYLVFSGSCLLWLISMVRYRIKHGRNRTETYVYFRDPQDRNDR